jgi:hypothetical protein
VAEMRATVLQSTVLYEDGVPTCVLPEQNLVAVRVTSDGVVTILLVDRALLGRGGVVRVGG